jgi:hypothetical protein
MGYLVPRRCSKQRSFRGGVRDAINTEDVESNPDPDPASDVNDIRDPAVARELLARAGRLKPGMSDDEVVAEARAVLREQIPAPPIPAGSSPISARAWLSDALTAGGFAAPEDRKQRAEIRDGGPSVDLSVLATLVMRHRSRGGARPSGWDDTSLGARIRQPAEDLTRAQKLLDEVADDLGVPATAGPRWWERA